MGDYLLSLLIAVFMIIRLTSLRKKIIIIENDILLRSEIRRIVQKYPDTLKHLIKGFFKKHELIKSLKGKIFDELSDKKLSVNDRRNLEKTVLEEIHQLLREHEGRYREFKGKYYTEQEERLGRFKRRFRAILFLGLIAILLSPIISSKLEESKEEVKTKFQNYKEEKEYRDEQVANFISSAKSHMKKSEFSLAKKDLDNALILNKSSKDAATLLDTVEQNINDYNYYIQAKGYLKKGEAKLAVKQFKKISKKSDKYKKAQNHIENIERNLFLEDSKDINYKILQKSPQSSKGSIIHLYGKIYNIQEVNGKIILTLSTIQENYETNGGNEAVILYPKTAPLNEGDYIHIYGEMLGNYSKSNQNITNYLKSDQYTIYFDQRTFIEQAPVVKTKIIVDLNGNMYE